MSNDVPDNKFVRTVIDAYHASHLVQEKTGVRFSFVQVVEHKEKRTWIEEADGGSFYDGQNQYIGWNPNQAIITDKGYVLSPLTGLNHESGHRLDEVIGEPPGDTRGYGGDAEEYRVMKNAETPVAQALGEVPKGQLSRNQYEVVSVITKSPFSNKIDIKATISTLNSYYDEVPAQEETVDALKKLGYNITINSKTRKYEVQDK